MNTLFEPIAIIGIGCRFPGGCNSPESFWELLQEGRDAIRTTPEDRWNLEKFYSEGSTKVAKTQSKWGGYVDGIDQFDPDLFGISPREAAWMDPQQRMLLEVAYRAAEDAGVPQHQMSGQPISVHVGISSFDYAVAGLSFRDRSVIGPYTNTGGSSSIAANRISYCFDLRGESVAVDTACSSSLIATHMACQSLQDPRNSMAFAGGVNALLLPDFYVAFSQLGVLSPDGRCKTFDASANGYVRAEGAGMVLLKRHADAVRDGDSVYAVIHSTATNQDGRTDGMTVPNQSAQEMLIADALANAGRSAHEVSYVEAHGTGTPVGDPIEASAIANSYGKDRKTPCRIASVKTNIGHLEAGAGIASVIKVALAVKNRQIPAHLNLTEPNPKIDFASGRLHVPTTTEAWDHKGPRLAAINGFGYGGANAHLILGEPANETASSKSSVKSPVTSSAKSAAKESGSMLLPLSAHSKSSMATYAGEMADWLSKTSAKESEIVSTATLRRTHHNYRVGITGGNRQEWIEQLREIADNADELIQPIAPSRRRADAESNVPTAFVCSGQGPQWWAMGRGLLESSPVFREVIESCDREFAKYVTWSLLDELTRDESQSRMHETSIAQPSIFALQVALAAVWRSRGVVPTVVVGHSVGEIAAAHLSGALTFTDACCVAVHRGRTMDAASSKGAMIAVGLSPEETERWIDGIRDRVAIAAVNGPTSLTISGCADAIAELHSKLDDAGIFCRRLQVEYAFHSPQMDPVEDELLRSLAAITPRETHTPMISTVTGDVIEGTQLDGVYWWKNVRHSVWFADAMMVLAQTDCELAIEIGPHPVLAYSIAECFQSANKSIECIASLNRKLDDDVSQTSAIASLFRWGYPIDWNLCCQPMQSFTHKLPPVAMTKQSLWTESFESVHTKFSSDNHPLLGGRVEGAGSIWEGRLDTRVSPYLADHRVRESCVLPAAAMLEIARGAATYGSETQAVSLRRFRLQNPCLLSDDSPQRIQTRFDADRLRLELSSSPADDSDWSQLATVDISSVHAVTKIDHVDLDSTRDSLPEEITAERLYQHCVALGLNYGTQFRGVVSAQRQSGHAVVEIDLPGSSEDECVLHPALLDSCFHGMIAADPDFEVTFRGLYLPQSIASIDIFESTEALRSGIATADVRVLRKDDYRMVSDIDIYNHEGQHCVAIRGFESVCVTGTAQRSESVDDLIYRYVWQPAAKSESTLLQNEQRKWIVFCDQAGNGQYLVDQLGLQQDVIAVQHGSCFKRINERSFIIDPESAEEFERLLTDVGDGVTDMVYLWGLDTPDNEELGRDVLAKSTLLTTLAPMHLVQAWEKATDSKRQSRIARFALITCDAQPPDDTLQPIAIASAPLIGFGRVIASESARLATRLVDISRVDSNCQSDLLAELTEHTDREDEVMYRDAIRWVRRFVPTKEQPVHRDSNLREPCILRPHSSASIADMRYETVLEKPLATNEVEIEVIATGLNFSDVMKSLNLYPGLPDGPVVLGAECSGRITRVGSDVMDFSVGDEVVSIAPGSFASHVTVKACMVATKPTQLTHEQAATVPIAFLTADYALNECARVRKGETVLIHAASGGVGIAAMQLARLAGVKVFGTAGTEEKRQFVRDAGAALVMDSRTLEFAQQTMDATDGVGVDAILNSLPGEAIAKGLSILKTGGRFLEIGKRDIYADAPLGLEPFKNNLAMFAIDLDQLFREQPERMGQMLREMMPKFSDGKLQPLPETTFDADDTRDAFRLMQQGKHIGKVVVDYRGGPTEVFVDEYQHNDFSADRSYWLAGGLGGFGLRIAQWMIERGARELILGGRSEKVPAESQRVLDEWASRGIKIHVMPVDLNSMQSVESVVAKIDSECAPLAGVIHTAMILEDRLLVDLDRETLMRVLGPKVLGGWNLHAATAEHDLDLFVLFSSLSSVFGHAGQANYSAANAFLDSLAHYRRSLGMPAVAINWGHVGEVGYLSRRDELSERLERQGVLSFTADEATQCLEYALGTNAIQQSVLKMDWTLWRGLGITGEVSPRFAHLLRGRSDETAVSGRLATASEVRDADATQRKSMVADIVGGKASKLLGITPAAMEWDRSLLAMGLDSLMAVEMRNWVESHLEIELPISELMRGESLDQICDVICEIVGEDEVTGEVSENASADVVSESAVEDQVADLSDDQVEAMLAQMLSEQDNQNS